jgi:hypothetical protein
VHVLLQERDGCWPFHDGTIHPGPHQVFVLSNEKSDTIENHS